MFDFKNIDSNWTLFLDRDGVINHEQRNDYVKKWDEFKFYTESLMALPILANKFSRIVITTNQKGVSKELMTEADLLSIHQKMVIAINEVGGRIDHIFYCTDFDNDSFNRKPQPGMAFQAKEKFTSIQFEKSIMVGNRTSDMEFGRNAGLHTVFLATTHPETSFPNSLIDYRFNNLLEFAQALL
jgi:histidinol-phosphate phosphatase family protein